jgi:hypothetical protein
VAAQPRVHVFLLDTEGSQSPEQFVEQTLPSAQEFLDALAADKQLSYRIVNPVDFTYWAKSDDSLDFQMNITFPMFAGMQADAELVHPDGALSRGTSKSSPRANAFRYYRFASSSEDLFEAYRYLYLSLESALHDLHPKIVSKEKEWLKSALQTAVDKYSLDFSAFSATGSDPIDDFYDTHYKAIRCATFHAKADAFLPGDSDDVKRVAEQTRMLQPIVKDLLKEDFGAKFLSSGMTLYAMNKFLENLFPRMSLATSPIKEPNLEEAIRSALTSSGFYAVLPAAEEEATPGVWEKIQEAFERAQQRFAFDFTPLEFQGKRPGSSPPRHAESGSNIGRCAQSRRSFPRMWRVFQIHSTLSRSRHFRGRTFRRSLTYWEVAISFSTSE